MLGHTAGTTYLQVKQPVFDLGLLALFLGLKVLWSMALDGWKD